MRAEPASSRAVYLVVPGTLETLTGGYLYDRRILEGLRQARWAAHVVSLDKSFPAPTPAALDTAESAIAAIPDGSLVVFDGLALSGLVPLLPEIAGRLKAVALIHHPLADETGLDPQRAAELFAIEKAALAIVPRVIVTSPWTRRRLGDLDVDAGRVAVVEPGIDRGPVPPKQPSSTVRLLSVATITPRKGHADLIAALAPLRDLDWSLRCAGSLELDRRCASELKAAIDRAGLADRVELLGEVAPGNVGAEYAGADLFVLPSWLEGYGMALAEAVAYGLPVVSTTAGAIPDTVAPAAARLVAPGDVEALSRVLRELIGNPAALAEVTRGAVAAAATVPTWDDAARKFAVVLEEHAAS